MAGEDSNATFVRNPGEFEDDSIDFDLEPRTGEIPAEFLREERRQIKLAKPLTHGWNIEWHELWLSGDLVC